MAVADTKWMNCNLQREGEEGAGGASEKRWNGSNEEEMSGRTEKRGAAFAAAAAIAAVGHFTSLKWENSPVVLSFRPSAKRNIKLVESFGRLMI